MMKIPGNVLVVDDEKEFLELFSLRRLKEAGENVRGAYSGEECLGVLAKADFDVVILDVEMPGMDGIETLRAIKRRHPLIEVILLAGQGPVDAAVEGMKSGAFDYVHKPSDFNDLFAKLEKARQRKAEQEQRIRQAEARAFMRRKGSI